ncbi:MAG: hypothetical protein ACYS47_17320 [Planctomycetota bacterium]|jgi:hypothetical protein
MKHLPGALVGFAAGLAATLLVHWALFGPKEAWLPGGGDDPAAMPGEGTPADSGAAGNEEEAGQPLKGGDEPPAQPGDTGGRPAEATVPRKGAGLAVLHGKVVYGAKECPVPGVLVVFSKGGDLFLECFTDEQGRFAVGLPAGQTWRATALPFGAWGMRPYAEAAPAENGRASVKIVIPDRGTWHVSGIVKEEGGKAVGGVKVRVEGAGGAEAKSAETMTGPDGSYEIRNIEVRLPMPSSGDPMTEDDFSFYRSIDADRKIGARPVLSLTFSHPEHPTERKSEHSDSPDGRIRCDVTLRCVGTVSGSISAPEEASLDGKILPYLLKKGRKTHRGRVAIEGNRFRIVFPKSQYGTGSMKEGKLVVGGGLVGTFWAEKAFIGAVDKNTRKRDVRIKVRALPVHRIDLLDQGGKPLLEAPDVGAWVRSTGVRDQALEVSGGQVVMPVFFEKTAVLTITGADFPKKKVDLVHGELPHTVMVETLPLLMTGTIRFPPGFEDWEEVTISYTVEWSGGRMASVQKGLSFDRTTGAFRIKRLYSVTKDGGGSDAIYEVTLRIPGYKAWKKKQIRLKETETMKGVVVAFEK